jgi:hypothetical protein
MRNARFEGGYLVLELSTGHYAVLRALGELKLDLLEKLAKEEEERKEGEGCGVTKPRHAKPEREPRAGMMLILVKKIGERVVYALAVSMLRLLV